MKNINVGLCGYGFIGKTHAIAYRAMAETTPIDINPQLYTLCSSSVTDNSWFKEITSNYDFMAKNENIDMVDICTPDFLHYTQAMTAIENKKHIYLEKPIAQTLGEAKEIATAAERAGLVNQTALVMRFQPKVAAARELLQSGELGEVINFKAVILNNSYLNPNRPVNWRLQKDQSAGGSLMDTGVHVADLIRFLIGEPSSVSCRTSTYFKERFTDDTLTKKVSVTNDEWSFMDLTLEDGVKGGIETSRIAAGVSPRNYIEIFCSKGHIFIDLISGGFLKVYDYTKQKEYIGPFTPNTDWGKHLQMIYPRPMFDMGTMLNTHSASAMNMLFNIVAGKVVMPETPTLDEAYRSQAVIEMGYLSAKEGSRTVCLNEIK